MTYEATPNIKVSKQQARAAVIQLLEVIHMRTRVSKTLAKFLLAVHAGDGEVNLGVYCSLSEENRDALQDVIRYSLFQRNYEVPLEWREAQALVAYLYPKRFIRTV